MNNERVWHCGSRYMVSTRRHRVRDLRLPNGYPQRNMDEQNRPMQRVISLVRKNLNQVTSPNRRHRVLKQVDERPDEHRRSNITRRNDSRIEYGLT
ncbi:hypothetical protein RSAG8_08966, partial [Rhizoctonia solani AG-8 WAC10335]